MHDDDHNGEAVSSFFSKSGTWQQIGATSHADSRKHVGRKEIAVLCMDYVMQDLLFVQAML